MGDTAAEQPSINARVEVGGDLSGQLVIGHNNVVNTNHGIWIDRLELQVRAELRRIPDPAQPDLPPFPGFRDRHIEVNDALKALGQNKSVEFHGPPGIGKTSLLRRLAYEDLSFRDGVVSLRVQDEPVNDVLQALASSFYESDIPRVLLPGEFGRYLRPLQALVLLDDVSISRDDVEAIMGTARSCAFVVASPQRRLWAEARSLALGGLPAEEAIRLIEDEFGRALVGPERHAAQAFCEALSGHPHNIQQEAYRLKTQRIPLTEAILQLQAAVPDQAAAANMLASLSPVQRQIVELLQVMGGRPLDVDHVTALLDVDATGPARALAERTLARANSPRYQLIGTLGQVILPAEVVTRWQERLLAHFVAWCSQSDGDSQRLVPDIDAILHTMDWAHAHGRWREVQSLVRAVEGVLAQTKRWERWRQVLRWGLDASQALQSQSDQAWALHQLGSRSLCLGEAADAGRDLAAALRIRQVIGDEQGAAVTRHNLELLGPPPPPEAPDKPPKRPSGGRRLARLAIVSVLLLVVAVLIWDFWPIDWPASPATAIPPTRRVDSATRRPDFTSPNPEVFIWLTDGCDREYPAGAPTEILFESSIDSGVSVRLDDREFIGVDAMAGETYIERWRIVEEPGEHRLTAVLDGNQAVAECWFWVEEVSEPGPDPGQRSDIEYDTDRPGGDFASFELPGGGPEQCQETCLDEPDCQAWTYAKPGVVQESAVCFLKGQVPPPVGDDCCISGVK